MLTTKYFQVQSAKKKLHMPKSRNVDTPCSSRAAAAPRGSLLLYGYRLPVLNKSYRTGGIKAALGTPLQAQCSLPARAYTANMILGRGKPPPTQARCFLAALLNSCCSVGCPAPRFTAPTATSAFRTSAGVGTWGVMARAR